jgi:hypothetical protein
VLNQNIAVTLAHVQPPDAKNSLIQLFLFFSF